MSVAPSIEELLDRLESESYAAREGIGLRSDYEDARLAILARYAELERERDDAVRDGEIVNVLRHALESRQRELLANYRRDRTTYREGASDAADTMLTVFDRAIAQRGGKGE